MNARPAETPCSAFLFVLGGLLGGGIGGFLIGQAIWGLAFNNDDFLRWLHPEIGGSTNYFLSIFFFNLLILPVLMALLLGIILPLVYAAAKWNRWPRLRYWPAMSMVLVPLAWFTVVGWIGSPRWYVLALIHGVPVLGFAGLVTYGMVRAFSAELAKLAPVETAATAAPSTDTAISPEDRTKELTRRMDEAKKQSTAPE